MRFIFQLCCILSVMSLVLMEQMNEWISMSSFPPHPLTTVKFCVTFIVLTILKTALPASQQRSSHDTGVRDALIVKITNIIIWHRRLSELKVVWFPKAQENFCTHQSFHDLKQLSSFGLWVMLDTNLFFIGSGLVYTLDKLKKKENNTHTHLWPI